MWRCRRAKTYIVVLGILFLMSFIFTPTPTPIQGKIPIENYNVMIKKIISVSQDDYVPKLRTNMINILIWSGITSFTVLIEDDSFVIEDCEDYTNCYVTHNRTYLPDVSYFDAVVFGADALTNQLIVPNIRSQKQKYIFNSFDPPSMFPVTDPVYDSFFNWTWTYRLSSEISSPFVAIYDINFSHDLIGPAIKIKWPEFSPSIEPIKSLLKPKTRAAVWFASECKTSSRREDFVQNLTEELKVYGLDIDVNGACGQLKKCEISSNSCLKYLQKTYYFYLSFEKLFDEDYVTKDILIPLQNFIVPVVYGGANYSRFLPPDSYLDARELGPKKLAKTMNDIIKNSSFYLDFFRWTGSLQYYETDPEICNICAALNNEEMVKKVTVYDNFRSWWNGTGALPRYNNITREKNLGHFTTLQNDVNYYSTTDSTNNLTDTNIIRDILSDSNTDFSTITAETES